MSSARACALALGDAIECPDCAGTGQVWYSFADPSYSVGKPCETCDGEGLLPVWQPSEEIES